MKNSTRIALTVAGALLADALMLAASVWIVVRVLQWTGVIS